MNAASPSLMLITFSLLGTFSPAKIRRSPAAATWPIALNVRPDQLHASCANSLWLGSSSR